MIIITNKNTIPHIPNYTPTQFTHYLYNTIIEIPSLKNYHIVIEMNDWLNIIDWMND